jgi:hypothetical protein
MPIPFNKKNLIYLLLIANLERKKGNFVEPLIEHLSDAVDKYNKAHKAAKNKISRGTFYNYLGDIDYLIGSFYTHEQANDLAVNFERDYKNKKQKFYNHFNSVLFDAFYGYLVLNDAIDRDKILDAVSGIDNSLYFAMASFLNVDKKQMKIDCKRLPGFYRVYRPSLSMKGKVIVSCARISITENDAILYNEIMHYKFRKNWRRQVFKGYMIRKKSTYILETTDSNTSLLQHSMLKAKYVHANKIYALSGSYNGESNNVKTGFFSTGIHFVREEFPELGDIPFEEWDVRSIPQMGLIDKEEIEEGILDDLFNYPQDYKK